MSDQEDAIGRTSRSLSLTTGGLTLLGILLSIGVTVAFAMEGSWWVRTAVGVAITALLIVAVKLGTASGRGPIAQLANWVIGQPQKRPGGEES